ncbi:MAG TPA: PD-(D/E)XK nuclease family protein [Planktothrix sp.]|jgi:ATP-dependent helicase/DNAse subunit B
MIATFQNSFHRMNFGQRTVAGSFETRTELLVGPYRSGKTLALIEDLVSFCSSEPFAQALVIVPSQRYRALFEKRLLQRLQQWQMSTGKKVGIAGLQILPFYKACQLLLRKAGAHYRIIPEAVRAAVIMRVLSDLRQEKQIQTLEPIVGFAGTHASLLELIDELQRAALSPEEVLERLELTAQSESRYIELARIYARYWQQLDALGYKDERGAAFAARRVLNQKGSTVDFGLVAADGFDRFNVLQLHVLEAISRKAGVTKICFDYVPPEEDRAGDYIWKEASFAELATIFKGAAQSLFQGSDSAPHTVSKRQTLDRFFEAAEVARSIKQSLANGADPAKILVVARSISSYTPPIHAAFDDAGISYFLDEAVTLTHLPIVQVVLRLVELSCVRNYKRNDIIQCLRSPHFRYSLFADTDKDLAKLEQLSLSEQIIETKEQWLQLIERKKDDLSEHFCKAFRQWLEDVVPPVAATLREFVSWVEDLLDRYIFLSSTHEEDPFRRWEEHRGLSEIRRNLAGLIHEENIVGVSNNGGQYFLLRLRTLLERGNFRRLPQTPDAITICSADLAPNIGYDEVFVLGLAEGEFPRRAKEKGFLSADEVGRWLSFGVDLRNPRYHPAFESALFSSLVNRARNSAHLSCPVFDTAGEELVPSYFMTGGKEDCNLAIVHPFEIAQTLPVSPREAVAGYLWLAPAASLDRLKSFLPLTTLAESLAEPVHIAKLRAFAGAQGEFNGDLREFVKTNTLNVKVPEQWSPTRLNDYGKCPFRYWATHVMKVEPVQEPEAGLNPMIVGDTYHKALELFYRTLGSRNLNIANADAEQLQKLFQGAVNAALALLESRADVRHGEFWRYERNEIAFRLNRFFVKELQRARQDPDQYVATLTEASFGTHDSQNVHLKIRGRDRNIMIRGRIDRVDVAPALVGVAGPKRVRIIDYKAGSSPITRDDAITGRNIQLPLYALAIERSIMPGSKVTSGYYLSVSSGEPIGRLSFDPDDKQNRDGQIDVLKVVEEHVSNFVAGIADGDFSIRPNGMAVCKTCVHKSVCRIRELAQTSGGES